MRYSRFHFQDATLYYPMHKFIYTRTYIFYQTCVLTLHDSYNHTCVLFTYRHISSHMTPLRAELDAMQVEVDRSQARASEAEKIKNGYQEIILHLKSEKY